jgi:hypothetical protein
MKKFCVGLVLFCVCLGVYGQGSVFFNNYVSGSVDARIILPDGTGAGAGWTAELVMRSSNGQMTVLAPTTTFRTSSAAAMGYVNPIVVEVPGVSPGMPVTLMMRAYNGSSYDTSNVRFVSNEFTVSTGGDVFLPANLVGLKSLTAPPLIVAPVITLQPISQAVVFGASIMLQVEASGTGPLSFQWLKNGLPVPGATAKELLINNVTPADLGSYSVTVSNASGSAVSENAVISPFADENTGIVSFNNHVPGLVEARVILADGTAAGDGFSAQLYGAAPGQPLKPLFPATTFRTSSASAMGYVNPVVVIVPAVTPGRMATLVVRVFNGATFETSTVRLESNPITIAMGGGTSPPANLVGLESFHVTGVVSPFVERFLPTGYAAGAKLLVTLKATPATGTTLYAIEETPPLNWIAGNPSDNGLVDRITGKVKFGPFSDNKPRLLTYELTPAAGEVGARSFSGIASADGQNTIVFGTTTIESVLFHPADINFADGRLSSGEVNAYGAAWRKGQTWTVGPSPVAIEFVTRAGMLWKKGEAYSKAVGITSAPLWWVSSSVTPGEENAQNQQPKSKAASFLHPLFVPGESRTIEVEVAPAADVSSYAVEDEIPSGWTVGTISDGGEFDAVSGRVKWGPFFDSSPKVLSYEAIAPATGKLEVAFSGTASFDGTNVSILGQRQARASSRLRGLTRAADGKIEIEVSGHVGAKVTVEGSSDLKTWVAVGVINQPGGAITFKDTAAGIQELRFYRVVVE